MVIGILFGVSGNLNPTEIGARLKATRKALGLRAGEFAKAAHIAQNAYSQYETGSRLLTPSAAARLAAAHRLTFDWLYRGDPFGLPHSLAQRLALNGQPQREDDTTH